MVTGFTSMVTGQAFIGEAGVDVTSPVALRAALACGIYLTLMALLAAGLAALLRSGTAVLSILIPFTLIVSFVVADLAREYAQCLPDQAGQVALHSKVTEGALGPWSGLAVTAAWSAAALPAGWWAVRRRDA